MPPWNDFKMFMDFLVWSQNSEAISSCNDSVERFELRTLQGSILHWFCVYRMRVYQSGSRDSILAWKETSIWMSDWKDTP